MGPDAATPPADPQAQRETLLAEASFFCDYVARVRLVGEWMPVIHAGTSDKVYVVTGGRGRLTVDGRAYDLHAGRVMLLPAGALQRGESDPSDPLEKTYVHFRSVTVNTLHLMRFYPPPMCLEGEGAKRITSLVAEMDQEWRQRRSGRVLALNAALMRVLLTAYRAAPADHRGPDAVDESVAASPRDEQYDTIRAALRTISRRYADPLTVADLADEAHLTASHFGRLFSQLVGTPPMRFVEAVRIREARELLARTDEAVAAVAQRVGYADPNYFSRVFHRHAGASPSDYRVSTRAGSRKDSPETAR